MSAKKLPRKAKAPAPDWVAMLEAEAKQTGKTVAQLLAEKAGGAHPELLELAAPPWGLKTEQIAFCIGGAEKLALERIRKTRFKETTSLGSVAAYVMAAALCHPNLMDQWLDGIVDYQDWEGMDQWTFIRSRIWGQPEYHEQPAVED